MSEETKTPEKKVKKKGPIRFEAIIPVTVIMLLSYVYFTFYFDHHLKKLFEYVGTQANGAEVNVDSVRTSFIKASFDLNRLQVTDKEKPSHNALEIENMHFQYLWDALLRMKFVVVDASINNIQIAKPRAKPGFVLPPEPAKPSKLNEIQNQVFAQVKNKYGKNVLGDMVTLLEGGDYKDQLEKIRGELKSEARVAAMVADVNAKKSYWDGQVKTLSDTTKIKSIEKEIQSISKDKNVMNQVQGVKRLNDLLKEVNNQYNDIQSASKKLQSEVTQVTNYPKELEALVKDDIAALKNRLQIPQIDFKDMAMHLFAGQFAEHIAKARKYQALAKQYIPEKKEADKEQVVPRKRNEGENFQFPITTGYPLFWLKRAAISSKGTAESYSGNLSGELTNVTTSPKFVKKPVVLDLRGDFPASQIMGVKAMITADFTKDIGRQSALIQVNSFNVPEKMFVNDEKLKFGFQNAVGTTTLSATLVQDHINMNWNSALNKPKFIIESKTKIAQEMLTNIMNGIPMITINGSASGKFSDLSMNISSNIGDELGNGFKREVGNKIAETQSKIQAMVDEKIMKPKEQLLAQISGTKNNLSNLNNVSELYKKNEARIKEEIKKLQKGGTNNLKEQGKKLLKGFKL